jgi:cell division protein FtsW
MSLINRLSAELKGDRVIWMILAILALMSILTVYSSAGTLAFKERGGDTEYYLLKQTLILSFGLFLSYIFYLIHYQRYSIFAPYALAIIIPLLIITLLLGKNINEASRWLSLPGIGITFQTSDLAKLAIITYVARAISAKQDIIKDFQSAFVPIILPVIIVCALIAPADLSTAIIIFSTCLAMMFVGRVDLKFILLLIFCGIVTFAGLLLIANSEIGKKRVRAETWKERLNHFFSDTDSDEYIKKNGLQQAHQAKIAIAKGGWIGNGPGSSTQRNFLPSPYTDYIYSIIIEEYGILGASIILGLFVLLFFRCVRLVTLSPKAFGAILAMGLGTILVLQALANMAVSVHLIPVAGLPMPMISMGGTSLIFSCVAFGMILSVSKYIEQSKGA